MDGSPDFELGPGLLRQLLRMLLGKLCVAQLELLVAFLSACSIGTGCSGIETPSFALEALALALSDLGYSSPAVPTLFACEISRPKRDFIESVLKVPLIFGDMVDMGKSHAWDFVSNALQAVPGCRIYVAGFSCKDMSSLNAARRSGGDIRLC